MRSAVHVMPGGGMPRWRSMRREPELQSVRRILLGKGAPGSLHATTIWKRPGHRALERLLTASRQDTKRARGVDSPRDSAAIAPSARAPSDGGAPVQRRNAPRKGTAGETPRQVAVRHVDLTVWRGAQR